MDVKIKDTFFDSLKKLADRERWYWKSWDFVRYDAPAFLSNIWNFRKALWRYRWYSYGYSLEMFKTGIELMEKKMHNGHEIEKTRNKKIAKMQRAILLMDHVINDAFIELAEKELGEVILHDWEFEPSPDHPGSFQMIDNESEEEKAHNSRVFARAREIEKLEWKELWEIMNGQDYSKFSQPSDNLDHDKSYDHWNEQFDGSGLRGWWD
jgi:hypothetical protein